MGRSRAELVESTTVLLNVLGPWSQSRGVGVTVDRGNFQSDDRLEWWTLTHEAPLEVLSRALRIGQSAIASEPSSIASVSR